MFRSCAVLEDELVRMALLLNEVRSYDKAVGHLFPATERNQDGSPRFSWRVVLQGGMTPYGDRMSGKPIANWQDDEFRWLRSMTFATFEKAGSTEADILAIVGDDTPVGNDKSRSIGEIDPDTILLLQVHDSRIHWMEPREFALKDAVAIGEEPARKLLADKYKYSYFMIGFADGNVWAIDPSVPMNRLVPLMTVAGAKTVDRESLLGRWVKCRYPR
jgi:hypothetical protein